MATMPEIVDDTRDGLESNWKPALAYGAGTGIGRNAFGPLGHGAGALVSGSYVGGTKGNTMASIGMGEAIAQIIAGGAGAAGGSGGSTGSDV